MQLLSPSKFVVTNGVERELTAEEYEAKFGQFNSAEVLANMAIVERAHRAGLMAASDWVETRALRTGTPMSSEWEVYRQALRDISNQENFPLSVIWPEKPK